MRGWRHFTLSGFFLICTAAHGSTPAAAEALDDFYRGKTISIVVFGDPGSNYDVAARVLSHYMPNFIPGHPAMVIRNIPGAGGIAAARYLYASAPRDATVIGTFTRGLAFEPLLGNATLDFDPLRFKWIGSLNKEMGAYVSWFTSAVKTAQDLMEKDLLFAGTGAGADTELITSAMNGLLGTRLKVISGYTGAAAAALAMERGEVEGMVWSWTGFLASKPEWIRDKKINILFQTRYPRHPDLVDTPSAADLAKDDADRRAVMLVLSRDVLGRPFMAPPGVPADRLALLRQAFDAAVNSPELKEEARKAKLEVELVTGEEIEQTLRDAYATPASIVDRIRRAMGRGR